MAAPAAEKGRLPAPSADPQDSRDSRDDEMNKPNDVNVSPNDSASVRTKNRLRENGPKFRMVATTCNPLFRQDGRVWMLFETDTWLGWLPIEEINISKPERHDRLVRDS